MSDIRPCLLALDPSLTATGVAVLELGPAPRVVHVECVRTKREAKSAHIYQADQDGQRIDAIADRLLAIFEAHHVVVVACEAPAGSQHANAAKALGLAYATCRSVARTRGLSPLMVQAFEARVAACGKKTAGKLEVEAAMLERWGRPVEADGCTVVREAVADALAVACVAINAASVRSLIQMMAGGGV